MQSFPCFDLKQEILCAISIMPGQVKCGTESKTVYGMIISTLLTVNEIK